MRTLLRTSLPFLLAAVAGCASSTTSSAGGTEAAASPYSDVKEARLVVSNRTTQDMDIYAVRSGGYVRVGFAPASESTTFRLNAGLLAGAGGLRFQGRPTQGEGQHVLSEPYVVAAGQEIVWDIPPQ